MPEQPTGLPSQIYLLSQDERFVSDSGVSVLDLWRALWDGKWVVAAVVALFAVCSVVYALTATEWYRADVLLAPAKDDWVKGDSDVLGGLGGLAGLAGLTAGSSASQEALAVLQSREFLSSFVEDLELMPVLFSEQWDGASSSWISSDAETVPDMRDAVRFIQQDILLVERAADSSLVTVAVEWIAPDDAASWANTLVSRLNDRLRDQALADSEANLAYLREQLGGTMTVPLQQSISRLLETEMQKVMLARGNDEYAFRILDPAVVPKQRERPNRTIIVLLGTFAGAVLAVLIVLMRFSVAAQRRPVVLDRG